MRPEYNFENLGKPTNYNVETTILIKGRTFKILKEKAIWKVKRRLEQDCGSAAIQRPTGNLTPCAPLWEFWWMQGINFAKRHVLSVPYKKKVLIFVLELYKLNFIHTSWTWFVFQKMEYRIHDVHKIRNNFTKENWISCELRTDLWIK